MIALELRLGDVLSASADALVVPIDGTFVPRDGQYERLLGNVGRQFVRRFVDAELIEQIEAQVDLPLALGRAHAVELDASVFKHAILVSSLHHVDHLDAAGKRALVQTCMRSAIAAAVATGAASLATPVLQGGWRLQPDAAFAAMLQAVATTQGGLRILVHCVDTELHRRLQPLARSMGFI